jgi:hypothetical protein
MSEPLYQIVARYQDDLAKLQDLDLPPEVVLDTIESMQGEVEAKVRAVVAYALDLERAAEAREAEAKRMAEGARRLADRAESIKMYAQIALMNSGLKLPLIAPEFTLNLAKLPPSVEITDPEAVPAEHRQTTITFTIKGEPKNPAWMAAQYAFQQAGFDMTEDAKPVKKTIGDALKTGAAVPGAKLAPVGYRLTVR